MLELCRDIKSIVVTRMEDRKNVVTFFRFIATKIKENGSKVLLRRSNLCCDIKNRRGKKECRDTTNYVVIENGRLKRQVKLIWSRQMF